MGGTARYSIGPLFALAASLAFGVLSCNDLSGDKLLIPAEPPGPAGNFQPIIHTVDGRHFAFRPESFEPSSIEHCREDALRHLTSMFELSRISPIGDSDSLCPELSGRYLRLHLTFVEGEAIKVTSTCVDGCVTPGGYYPPLGSVVRIPWSEIASVEFRR